MYDLILKGGLVIDGTRAEPYCANICIQDGRIAKITREAVTDAGQVLDVEGLAVTPGFIDIHSHSDSVPFSKKISDSKAMQGVTLELTGNCGSSQFPVFGKHEEIANSFVCLEDYIAAAQPTLIHYACLVGHSELRLSVMGFEDRYPSDRELEEMKQLLEQQMEQGAFGMSLGLIYPPSSYSSREELTELAAVVARHKGILSVHMRDEGPMLFEAVDEVLDIARRSGVHLQISHLKLQGTEQWGKAPLLLEQIRKAQAEGIGVTCDQYPFCASCTGLDTLVPGWAHAGGTEALMERLRRKEGDICEHIEKNIGVRGGTEGILFATTKPELLWILGKSLQQVCDQWQLSPVDSVIRILLETNCTAHAMYFNMNQEDMLAIMEQDFICVGSDGSSVAMEKVPTLALRHPRNYATFPRFWQTVREHRLMPMEDAVYKMTGLPASVMGLQDRGILKEGYMADIAVFDPEKFGSPATFQAPHVHPVGLQHLLVEGKLLIQAGSFTDLRAGKILRK